MLLTCDLLKISLAIFFTSVATSNAKAQELLETCNFTKDGGSYELTVLQFKKSAPDGKSIVRSNAKMVKVKCRTEGVGQLVCYRDDGKVRMEVSIEAFERPLIGIKMTGLETGLVNTGQDKYCYSNRTPTGHPQCSFPDGSDLTTDIGPTQLKVTEGARRDRTTCEIIKNNNDVRPAGGRG